MGDLACAVPIADVIETMRRLPISALSGTPAYVAGVCIVRGEPLPVVDLAALLKPGENASPRAWLVTVRVGHRAAVIGVDRFVGVRSFAKSMFSELPPLLQSADAQPLLSLGRLDHDLLVVLEASRVVPAELFEQMDAVR